MNTKIHMILEILPNSFGKGKGFSMIRRVFIGKSEVLQDFLLRRRRRTTTTTNKESLGKEIREQAYGQVIPLRYFKSTRKEMFSILKEKGKYTSNSYFLIHNGKFHHSW